MRAHHFILAVSIAITLGGSAKAAGGALRDLAAVGAQDVYISKDKQKRASPKQPSQTTPTNPNYNVPRVKSGMGGAAYSN